MKKVDLEYDIKQNGKIYTDVLFGSSEGKFLSVVWN